MFQNRYANKTLSKMRKKLLSVFSLNVTHFFSMYNCTSLPNKCMSFKMITTADNYPLSTYISGKLTFRSTFSPYLNWTFLYDFLFLFIWSGLKGSLFGSLRHFKFRFNEIYMYILPLFSMAVSVRSDMPFWSKQEQSGDELINNKTACDKLTKLW